MRYKHVEVGTLHPDEVEILIVAAQQELSDLCHGKRFRMSIPVDDADSDMVIGDALRHALALIRTILGQPASVDAVDPHAGSTGKLSTREKGSE